MADVYVLETVSDTESKFGDSLSTDLHGGATWIHTLLQAPSGKHPSFLVIQTHGAIASRDNPVMIVQNPSGAADWVLIGHLTRGGKTHIVEIGAPAVLTQSFQVNIQTRSVSGSAYGDAGLQPGALDDFHVTAIQVFYRPQ